MTFCSWSICSFLELLSGRCNLGFFLVQGFVTVSRFGKCGAYFLCTLWGPESEAVVLSLYRCRGSVALLFPRAWDPVLMDPSFSWLLTLDTFLTVVDLFWANTLSCPSDRARRQETRSSQAGQDCVLGSSAELGAWNSRKGYPLSGAIELLYLTWLMKFALGPVGF